MIRGRVLVWVMMFLLGASAVSAKEKWRRLIPLEGRWKFSIGDNKNWASPDYNDSDWETLHVPENWENQGFNGFDGFAWYRRSFDASTLPSSGAYHLFMGYIDDVDAVYLNGHLIGSSGSFPPRYHTAYNAERRYFIPSEYINFRGRNVISVRVFDAEIEGGIISGNIGIYTNENDNALALNLRGMWDFTIEKKSFIVSDDRDAFRVKRTPPEPGSWSKIMVPGLWEHQGYERLDGTAWYRKQFLMPKSLDGEDLVLILGKIDDYDQVYLNGRLVGATTQYDQLRIYNISADMFKAGAYNILFVYVLDYGGFGGIYEGPVGFMRQAEFTRFMRYRD